MYATTWLDRETFSAILQYCMAQPGYEGAEHPVTRIDLTGTAPPDIGSYAAVSWISASYIGEVESCAELFHLSLNEGLRTPRVAIRVESEHTQAEPPPTSPELLRREIAIHYSCVKHPSLFCSVVDHYSDGTWEADTSLAQGVLNTFLRASGLGEALVIRAGAQEGSRLHVLDERFAEAPLRFTRIVPENADLEAILGSGRYPVTLTKASVHIWGLATGTLPGRAGAFVEALSQQVTHAVAAYHIKPEEYEALRRAAHDVVGEWSASFDAKESYSVEDLVLRPQSIRPDITELTLKEFKTRLPVLGRVEVGVDAERGPGGTFRYRARFYHGYEREGIRKEPLADTAEGQALPYYAEIERELLAETPEREWIMKPEDLAIRALFQHWGDGRDLIDHDYEE